MGADALEILQNSENEWICCNCCGILRQLNYDIGT